MAVRGGGRGENNRTKAPNCNDYGKAKREFTWHVPTHYNFARDVVDRWGQEKPNKLALISVNDEGTEAVRLTFADLALRSNRFCNVLTRLGVEKGERALILVYRQPEWYDVLLGCIKKGVMFMPTTVFASAKDIEYRINCSGASIVISSDEVCDKVEEVANKCPTLRNRIVLNNKDERRGWQSFSRLMAEASPSLSSFEPTLASDTMLLFFTSGTTGNPKMVRHTHSYPLGHYITAYYVQDLKPDDIHWTLADTGWAKTAYGNLYGQWIVGATILQHRQAMQNRFDAKKTLTILGRFQVSTFCAPPTAYRMMILEDLKSFDLRSVRHCMSAGEPLNPEVIASWREGTGLEIYDFYGQTETVAIVGNMRCMPIKMGAMGLPLPGTTVEIIDDDGKPIPDMQEGHIAVKVNPEWPVGLFVDYWKNEEKTKEVFQHGYYYTLDKAYRDSDGYFWYVGRADDVIKSAGYRIGPFEIESVLLEHDAVVESAVVGVPDPEGLRGLIVKAFIVIVPHVHPTNGLKKELQEWVKQKTAPYKYPREVEFVKELPKTVSGKIKRAELRLQELQKAKEQLASANKESKL